MKYYINKDTLVAEIEKRRKEAESNCGGYKSYDEHRCDDCTVGFYDEFLEIINTLETKEVDLDKEIYNYLDIHNLYIQDGGRIVFNNGDTPNFWCDFRDIAKHFFELGVKVQKGE